MSLINDALKRAAEADKRLQGGRRRTGPRGPKGPEALGPPIEPVAPKRPRRVGFMFSPTFGLAMLIVILGCVGAFFIHSWWTSRPRFVLQDLPPGVDRLEAMIVETKVKKKDGGTGPIVVSEKDGTYTAAKMPEVPVQKIPDTPPKVLQVAPVEGRKTPEEVATEARARLTNAVPIRIAATNVVATAPTNLPPSALVKIMAGSPKKREHEFPAIQLGGIIIKRDSATAYINGKTLNIGDTVEGAELVEISLRHVTFALRGKEKKVYLPE